MENKNKNTFIYFRFIVFTSVILGLGLVIVRLNNENKILQNNPYKLIISDWRGDFVDYPIKDFYEGTNITNILVQMNNITNPQGRVLIISPNNKITGAEFYIEPGSTIVLQGKLYKE